MSWSLDIFESSLEELRKLCKDDDGVEEHGESAWAHKANFAKLASQLAKETCFV